MPDAGYNNKRLIKVSGIGHDRPGIVYKIANVIRAMGGNVLLQRSMQVAGDFAITVVASFENGTHGTADDINRALGAGTFGDDFAVLAREINLTNFAKSGTNGSRYVVIVGGPDRMGIVESMALFFLQNNINVDSMDSKVSHVAEHGTYMFDSTFEITVPEGYDTDALEAELKQIEQNSDLVIQIRRIDQRFNDERLTVPE